MRMSCRKLSAHLAISSRQVANWIKFRASNYNYSVQSSVSLSLLVICSQSSNVARNETKMH